MSSAGALEVTIQEAEQERVKQQELLQRVRAARGHGDASMSAAGSLQDAVKGILSGATTPRDGTRTPSEAGTTAAARRREPAGALDARQMHAAERALEESLGLRPGDATAGDALREPSPELDAALIATLPAPMQEQIRSQSQSRRDSARVSARPSVAPSGQPSAPSTPPASARRTPPPEAEEPVYTAVSVDVAGQYTRHTVMTSRTDRSDGDGSEALDPLRTPESRFAIAGEDSGGGGARAGAGAGMATGPMGPGYAGGYAGAYQPSSERYGGAGGGDESDRHWDEWMAAQGLREGGAGLSRDVDDSNWGEEMYEAWKEKSKKREKEYEEKRREGVRQEMAACTFSPSIDRKSKHLAQQGIAYPGDKWVRASPLTTPQRPRPDSPRKGGTSLSVEQFPQGLRLVDKFAGVGAPPTGPYRPLSGREGPSEGDVSTRACLRLYAYAQGKNLRLQMKQQRTNMERESMTLEDASRILNLPKNPHARVPSRWRQPRSPSPQRPPPPGAFNPDTKPSKRSFQMLKRLQVVENRIEDAAGALGDALFSHAVRGAGLDGSQDLGAFRVDPDKLDRFLARQQALLERKAQTAVRLSAADRAAMEGPGMSQGSKRILARMTGRQGVLGRRPPAGPGTSADDSSVARASPDKEQAGRGAEAGAGGARSGGRPQSAGPRYRGPGEEADLFRPHINPRSERLAPKLTVDEHFEKLYLDQSAREARLRARQAQKDAEELRRLPFKPRMRKSAASEGVSGKLRVLEDPEAYIDRATLQMQQKETERHNILRRRELEELQKCTFKPTTTAVPEYILRIAHSRHTRQADGVPKSAESIEADPLALGGRWN